MRRELEEWELLNRCQTSESVTTPLLHTGLGNLSQHLFSGAVVIGGADPHAEVLTTRHAGHCTAVGGGRADVGLSSVSLHLHSIGNGSEGRVPGCDQHVRLTLRSCLYVCW